LSTTEAEYISATSCGRQLLTHYNKQRYFATLKMMNCNGSNGHRWSFVTISQQSGKLVSQQHLATIKETFVATLRRLQTTLIVLLQWFATVAKQELFLVSKAFATVGTVAISGNLVKTK